MAKEQSTKWLIGISKDCLSADDGPSLSEEVHKLITDKDMTRIKVHMMEAFFSELSEWFDEALKEACDDTLLRKIEEMDKDKLPLLINMDLPVKVKTALTLRLREGN